MASFPHGTVVHFDLSGPDAAPLTRFYQGLFDWKVRPQGPGYALIETPAGGPNGAVVEAETTSLTVGVVVADLDRALKDAVALGGAVVMGATDNGWVKKGQVTDPAGNSVVLIQG